MPPEKIVITGATGYLGRHLMPHLQKAWPRAKMIGLARRGHLPSIRVIHCDLAQWAQVSSFLKHHRPSFIFHCAGKTTPSDWPGFFDAHIRPTAHLLEALAEQGGFKTQVIVVSSAAEYGAVPRKRQPILESESPHALSAYGRSKACQTAVALEYVHQGLSVIIARIFNVLGPRQPRHFAAALFAHALRTSSKKSPAFSTGSLEAVRDFLSIDDVCRALVALAQRGQPGHIYNVCSGQPVRMKALLQSLSKWAERSLRPMENKRGSLRTDVAYCVGNPGKIRRDTGWRPQEPWAEAVKNVWGSRT